MIGIQNALEPLKNNPVQSGIFSDLDGTLSEIAPTPGAATIMPDMRELIKKLADTFAIIGVVSGRDSDEAKRIVGLENLVYIGNHGLEWLEDGEQSYVPEVSDYFKIASDIAAELSKLTDGTDLLVEKKKLGVAIHYRQSKDKEAAKKLAEAVTRPFLEKYPLKKSEGRYIIELKPDLPINKGDAITVIALQRGLVNVMYLGDDITDIDAFKALKRLSDEGRMYAVSFAVNSDEASSNVAEEADYVLESVDEVRHVLSTLAD